MVREGFPADVAPTALRGVKVAIFQHYLTLADDHQGASTHFCPLKDVVLHSLREKSSSHQCKHHLIKEKYVNEASDQVVALSGDDLRHIWVPQHEVSIRTDGDAAFAGVQVEDLGCVCTSDCHKLVFIHLSSHL